MSTNIASTITSRDIWVNIPAKAELNFENTITRPLISIAKLSREDLINFQHV